jgi:hypothetical protein
MADGRWPLAEGSDGGWPKEALVAGHFCGLSPNKLVEPNHREKHCKSEAFVSIFFPKVVGYLHVR